jgi:hypothetical protein
MPWQDKRSEYLQGGAGSNMLIIYKMTYTEEMEKCLKMQKELYREGPTPT